MATLILRPISNGTVRHSLSGGNSGYSLINESSQDGDSTYIYQTISNTQTQSISSTFTFGGFDSAKIRITGCVLYYVARSTSNSTSNINISVSSNGIVSSSGQISLSSSYTSRTVNCSNVVEAMNIYLSSGQIPSISLQITTSGVKSSSKDQNYQIRLTQAYLEITYDVVHDEEDTETGLYIKINGVYVPVKRVWRKVNWEYVEQSDISNLFNENIRYVKI